MAEANAAFGLRSVIFRKRRGAAGQKSVVGGVLPPALLGARITALRRRIRDQLRTGYAEPNRRDEQELTRLLQQTTLDVERWCREHPALAIELEPFRGVRGFLAERCPPADPDTAIAPIDLTRFADPAFVRSRAIAGESGRAMLGAETVYYRPWLPRATSEQEDNRTMVSAEALRSDRVLRGIVEDVMKDGEVLLLDEDGGRRCLVLNAAPAEQQEPSLTLSALDTEESWIVPQWSEEETEPELLPLVEFVQWAKYGMRTVHRVALTGRRVLLVHGDRNVGSISPVISRDFASIRAEAMYVMPGLPSDYGVKDKDVAESINSVGIGLVRTSGCPARLVGA